MPLEDRISGLIRVAGRLIDLMRREIEILREMRPGAIDELQAQKNELADAYQQQVRGLADEPGALDAVAPALRQEFAEVAHEFNRVLAENESALHANRVAHERLIKAVIEAVGERRDTHKGYSADGGPPRKTRAQNSAGTSIALDTRL